MECEEREQLEDALLIYNSCLYDVINQLVAVPNFRERNPEELYKELCKDPTFAQTTHYFMRSMLVGKEGISKKCEGYDKDIYRRLGRVKVSTTRGYIESLISIYDTITKYKDRLQLQQDTYLYRGISNDIGNKQEQIARSECISTSLDYAVAKKFWRESKRPTFYMIKAKKGTKCMIVPYRLTAQIMRYGLKEEVMWVRYNAIDKSMESALQNLEIMLFSSEVRLGDIVTTRIDDGVRIITIKELEVEPQFPEIGVKGLASEALQIIGDEIEYIDATEATIDMENLVHGEGMVVK